MANRTYKFRGTKQPVSFGVEKLDGYIIEATEETIEGAELEIEDEDSNVVAHFSGFGIRNKRTASLIPLKGAEADSSPPAMTSPQNNFPNPNASRNCFKR